MREVVLRAEGLNSKFGFSDGEILEDMIPEKWWDAEHAILAHLVREKLLPLLDDRVSLFEIPTCHNPIRAELDTRKFVDGSVNVSVCFADVEKAVEQLDINE